jgi:hypothetical protein
MVGIHVLNEISLGTAGYAVKNYTAMVCGNFFGFADGIELRTCGT